MRKQIGTCIVRCVQTTVETLNLFDVFLIKRQSVFNYFTALYFKTKVVFIAIDKVI